MKLGRTEWAMLGAGLGVFLSVCLVYLVLSSATYPVLLVVTAALALVPIAALAYGLALYGRWIERDRQD